MTRYRATLAYDGSRYHGFQRQANASPTVQETVEAALCAVSGDAIGLLAAGRTDAGVHASGQVIAFDAAWQHPAEDLRNALNAHLPEDVAVRDVHTAADQFHPRFDARRRTYVYRLYVAEVHDPLRRLYAWHVRKRLNHEALNRAAEALKGEQDFSTFGTPPQGDNPVREVYDARWEAWNEGREQRFTITANAFLYRMVRSIVGTLVMVGQGRMTADAFQGILSACERDLSGPAAPACGLTLTAVTYDEN